MIKWIAYEGDDRLTGPVSAADAEQAIREARRAAGAFARRRLYRMLVATRADLARMLPAEGEDFDAR